MKIEIRQVGDVTVMAPTGKITIGIGDVALREAVSEALAKGSRKLVMNMAGVTMIDSSGVGELVSSYTRAANAGGRLKLCNLPPRVSDILQITQLITVFEVFESEQEAIESFA